MVKNARIENLILQGRDSEIPDAIKEGKESYKSQTFDQALLDMYAKGYISFEEAINNASVPNDLKMQLDFYDAEVKKRESIKEDSKEDKDILGLKL